MLKNAGATYQGSMIAIFQDMMHKEIENYVNDIVVRSGKGENYIAVQDRVLKPGESRYSQIEQTCLALVFLCG